MKAIKTLLFAAVAMLAIGAASCDKDKKSGGKGSDKITFESIMEEALEGNVVELSCDTVLTTKTEVQNPTVVYFFAQDAPICQPFGKAMDRLAGDNEGKVAVISVDVAACPKTAADFGLDSDNPLVPHVVILFPDGGMQDYPNTSDFLSPDLKDKTPEEQVDGIYANLINYVGVTEIDD